jgi:hypothetical protein
VTGGALLGPGPQRWRGVARVLPLILLFVLGAGYTWRVEGKLKCQARYNETNNERSRILTEAGDKERAATDRKEKAWSALVLNPAALVPPNLRTPKQRAEVAGLAVELQAAYQGWLEQRAAADRERAEHPVPPPPSSVCD